jgi:hypothetical protein
MIRPQREQLSLTLQRAPARTADTNTPSTYGHGQPFSAARDHRLARGSGNPHLPVTCVTKATRASAGSGYVTDKVARAGLWPEILRSSRLLAMINAADPNSSRPRLA